MQRSKIHDIHVKEPEPDKELLLWEKWIQIRNDETTKLAKKLKKPPVDLTMNLLEKKREEKEWKTALEYAQIDPKPSIRGGPWEQPQRLQQGCYCMPAYEIQRTLAELGKPAIIEHIRVPDHIQKTEKGLQGESQRIGCQQLNAEYKKYKMKREYDLKEKICKIDPFRPDPSGMIVKGSKPKPPPKKLPPVPNILIIPTDTPPYDPLMNIYAVRINNTVIFKDIPGHDLSKLSKLKKEPWHESCTNWSYYFHTPVKRAGRCKFYLQNLGTVTLRYCWKRIKRPIPFIPEDLYEQVFFFNRNEDVIYPGERKEIFFTFLSDTPGIYSEFWELSFCNISFYDTLGEKFIVNFYADSVENVRNIQKKCQILERKISRKANTNIVSAIIDEAFTEATMIEPQQYPYKKLFLESELFVMKNPVCFYHQTEVSKMKDLYCDMLPGTVWDLSIGTWREAMMAKDFDERMKYYELLRQSHSDLLKPWYEGETLLKEKHRAVNLLLGQMANLFDQKYAELWELLCPPTEEEEDEMGTERSIVADPITCQKISNLFYIHAYDYFAMTIEMCAGVLSSLDLNRWIEFDFCQW